MKLSEAQIRALEEIEANNHDDCTQMLPVGLVCLAKEANGSYVFPPKIVLTDSGLAALQEARG